MKPLLILLVCCSSLALALEGPHKAGGPCLPYFHQGKQTLTGNLPVGHPMVPHSSLRGTNSGGYDPWLEQVTGLPSGTGFYWINVVDSNTVWAAVSVTPPTVIRTTNGGTNWVCDTIKIAPVNCVVVGIYAFDAANAWVSMFNPNTGSGGGVFHTTDGGVTWTHELSGVTSPDFIHFFDPSNGVCVNETNDFQVYTTSDGGAIWSRVPQANIPPKISGEYGATLSFCAAGNSLWFWTVYGVQTEIGWKGTGRYYGSTDRGLTWTVHVYPGGAPNYGVILGFQDDNVGLASRDFGEISRTTDGGTTWTLASSPSHLFLAPTSVPGASSMYVGGAIWQYPDLIEEYISGTVYTTDGGVTWTGARAAYMYLDFASASAGWGFDPYWHNIYKWTMAQGRVIGTSVDSLIFVPLAVGQMSDTIAIDAVNFGSDPLIVESIVGPGANFTVVSQTTLPALIPPLGSVKVGLCFTPQSNGVFRDSLVFVSNASNAPSAAVHLNGGTTAIESTEELPKVFALSQNYPNPFNPTTVVSYQLPVVSNVKLAVYDILGREVAVLVNEKKTPGNYEVKFDGTELSSGVYFYRLTAGSTVETRKMVLMK